MNFSKKYIENVFFLCKHAEKLASKILLDYITQPDLNYLKNFLFNVINVNYSDLVLTLYKFYKFDSGEF